MNAGEAGSIAGRWVAEEAACARRGPVCLHVGIPQLDDGRRALPGELGRRSRRGRPDARSRTPPSAQARLRWARPGAVLPSARTIPVGGGAPGRLRGRPEPRGRNGALRSRGDPAQAARGDGAGAGAPPLGANALPRPARPGARPGRRARGERQPRSRQRGPVPRGDGHGSDGPDRRSPEPHSEEGTREGARRPRVLRIGRGALGAPAPARGCGPAGQGCPGGVLPLPGRAGGGVPLAPDAFPARQPRQPPLARSAGPGRPGVREGGQRTRDLPVGGEPPRIRDDRPPERRARGGRGRGEAGLSRGHGAHGGGDARGGTRAAPRVSPGSAADDRPQRRHRVPEPGTRAPSRDLSEARMVCG